MKKELIVTTISLLFVMLFLYTGISKLMDYSLFREQIAVSPILAPVASLIAWGLPVFEILLAGMLLIPRWTLLALKVSTALMAAFTIYIVLMMLLADHLPCSCGGIISALSWGQHIVFNSLFILLGIVAIILERQRIRTGEDDWRQKKNVGVSI